MTVYQTVPATELQDGSIIINHGCRCRVADFRLFTDSNIFRDCQLPVARYKLYSEPNERFPLTLSELQPLTEGYTSGGNARHTVYAEV